MIFSTTSGNLGEVLVNLNRVINSKNALPILADIVFSVKDKTLSLKASDGEITLTADIVLTEAAEGEGCFAVNAKNIMEAIKNLPETPLEFSVSEDEKKVKVDYFSGMFSLPIDNAEEFPVSPDMEETETKTFTISEGVLQENIARTIFATDDNELRIVMNGIYFDLTPEHLAVVASDGHLLVRNKLMTIKAEENGAAGFILPKKSAQILKTILRRTADDDVTISFDDRQAMIVAENFTMMCRLITGRYPNYNSVIPKNNPKIVRVERTTLIAALKRVSPFSNISNHLVCLSIEENKIQIDTEDYDFSKKASENIACDYTGEAIKIGLKGSMSLEILNGLNSKEVEIQLADPSRPVLIIPDEQPADMDVLMLQMPMLISC